jgi:hypothetical protein
LKEFIALFDQELQLLFLIGDTPCIQLLHSRAGKGGRLLLQIEEIPPDQGDAPFDLNKVERTAGHGTPRRCDPLCLAAPTLPVPLSD